MRISEFLVFAATNFKMYNFILQIILISSLATIVYLMARALPRVQQEEMAAGSAFKQRLEQLIKKIPLSKFDKSLSKFNEKTLRKSRVIVLRIDNFISNRLNKKEDPSTIESGDFLNQLNKKDDSFT